MTPLIAGAFSGWAYGAAIKGNLINAIRFMPLFAFGGLCVHGFYWECWRPFKEVFIIKQRHFIPPAWSPLKIPTSHDIFKSEVERERLEVVYPEDLPDEIWEDEGKFTRKYHPWRHWNEYVQEGSNK